MRKVCVGDERRDGAIRYLSVRVGCTHDAIYISYHDRFDLERAKFAVTAFGLIVSVGFDLDKRG